MKRRYHVFHGSAQAVELPDEQAIEFFLSRLVHHFDEGRALGVRATEAVVDVFAVDSPAAPADVVAELVKLHVDRLTVG